MGCARLLSKLRIYSACVEKRKQTRSSARVSRSRKPIAAAPSSPFLHQPPTSCRLVLSAQVGTSKSRVRDCCSTFSTTMALRDEHANKLLLSRHLSISRDFQANVPAAALFIVGLSNEVSQVVSCCSSSSSRPSDKWKGYAEHTA